MFPKYNIRLRCTARPASMVIGWTVGEAELRGPMCSHWLLYTGVSAQLHNATFL